MQKLRENFLDLIYLFGQHSGCHRIPERCFSFKGYIFPVCARCTGIFLSMPFALYYGIKVSFTIYIFLLLIPMGIDWWLTRISITKGTNRRRFVTGFLGGFAIYVIQINLVKIIMRLIWTNF